MFTTKKNTGFTLIELLVTLAVLAIVAMYAVPSFERMVKDNRIISQVKELSSLIAYARSEATKGAGAYVTICPTSDNATCSGGTNWGDGWMIMLDWNGDRTMNAGAETGQTDRLLRAAGDLSGDNTLSTTGFSASGYVQFDSTGMPINVGTLGVNPGTFVICDDRGADAARALVVMASGQIRLAVDSSDDGSIVEDHDGSNVTCT